MPSERRIEKLNMLLREEVARVLEREIDFPEHALITVTRVATSSDGHYATAFISIFNASSRDALAIIEQNIYAIQQRINRRLRLRPVPKLHFALDTAETHREAVEQKLGLLKQRGEL